MHVLYMVMSQDQNAGRNHRLIRVPLKGWKSSNIWEQILTNRNSIQEEIKSRLKSGQVQKILSSSLLPKNLKIKIYKIIFLSAVTYGHETWSLTFEKGTWAEGV